MPNRIPRVTFLDLPKSVRDKIYEECNIGGGKFIDLNFWTIRNEHWQDHNGEQMNHVPRVVQDDHRVDDCPSSFTEEAFAPALLWAGSRVIHQEVEAKLYAQNTFAVSLMGVDGLRPLEMLSDAALRQIRVLIVSLQPCKCLTPFCSKVNWGYGERGIWARPRIGYFWHVFERLAERATHSRPLGSTKQADKFTISRWQRICSRLGSNLSENQLKLYLVTDLEDLQTAHVILDPLKRMPLLKEAAISLGSLGEHLKDSKPITLARITALGLTSKPQVSPFNFMKLPVELQIKILKYTELTSDYLTFQDSGERVRPYRARKDCLLGFTRDENGLLQYHPLAFCARKRGASFSLRCECLPSPERYFLVNKAFGSIAKSVFHSSDESIRVPATRPTRWDNRS